jgi:hypothetical protein
MTLIVFSPLFPVDERARDQAAARVRTEPDDPNEISGFSPDFPYFSRNPRKRAIAFSKSAENDFGLFYGKNAYFSIENRQKSGKSRGFFFALVLWGKTVYNEILKIERLSERLFHLSEEYAPPFFFQ